MCIGRCTAELHRDRWLYGRSQGCDRVRDLISSIELSVCMYVCADKYVHYTLIHGRNGYTRGRVSYTYSLNKSIYR